MPLSLLVVWFVLFVGRALDAPVRINSLLPPSRRGRVARHERRATFPRWERRCGIATRIDVGGGGESVMHRKPIGRTSCELCGGTGKTRDDTPCATCKGTGLVPVFPEQSAPPTPVGQVGPSNRRRRFPRYYTDLPLTVRDQEEQEFAGRCVVISQGGLAAVLRGPIPKGTVVMLHLPIPTHPTALETWAVVRNQLGLRHGLEFVSLADSEREAIRLFCSGLTVQPQS